MPNPTRTIAVMAAALCSACFAYATTSGATRSVIPVKGISSSNLTSPQSSCIGNLWSCLDDPIGYPDTDASYVYTTASPASEVIGFSSSYSQITSVMLHVVAASHNGNSGTLTMSFYNGSQLVATGQQKTIPANSGYTEYASGIFYTSIANLSDITMKIALTGDVKYTAAWMDITYGGSGTASGNLAQYVANSNGPAWFAGSCSACAGGAGNATVSISNGKSVPSGGPYSTGTKIVTSAPATNTPETDSELEWVKLNQNSQNPAVPSSLVSLTGDWWVYPTNESANNPRTLEFDTFFGDGSHQAMWGSHCSLNDSTAPNLVWKVNTAFGEGWIPVVDSKTGSTIPCNLTPNQWHHITWQVHLDLTAGDGTGNYPGRIFYDYLTVDGTSYNIDHKTKVHAFTSGSNTRVGIQLQQDLNAVSSPVSITEYLDSMSFTYWQ